MSSPNLFSEFAATSEQEWREKIIKDLKGKAYEALVKEDPDGNLIQPIYTEESVSFQHQPLKQHPKWDNVYEILVTDAKAANAEALKFLNKGATSLLFYLDGQHDLERLLADIQLEYICTNLVIADHVDFYLQSWNELLQKRGLDGAELEGSINFDPLENLARTGNWFKSEEEDFASLKGILNSAEGNIRKLCLNVNLFANAGASIAQQIGIALAMATEYQSRLSLNDSSNFWLNVAVGSDYFGEIAKLRALRRVWLQWQQELGLTDNELRIYAESSTRNKSALDPYNNLIRSTTEGMAAVIGGATEVCLKSFDSIYQAPSETGRRLALNQLSMLQHESHLHQVRDMAGGAYFIENLTEEMAAKGWSFFSAIEEKGGYLATLKSGWLQAQIQEKAQAEQQAFDEGQKVMIGVNKFPNPMEEGKPVPGDRPQSGSPAKGLVEPIIPTRLSEKLEEQKRQNLAS